MFVASHRSRVGLRLLLAALLVFSQHQAVVHLLGHGLSQLSKQESTDPQESVCVRCLAVAHLDHAAAGGVVALESSPAAPARVATVPLHRADLAFFRHYRSRAPPSFS